MKIFMYSGGDVDLNESMDQELINSMVSVRPRMTYVPATSKHANEDYEIFIDYYSEYGINDFQLLDLGKIVPKKEIEKALKSDVIYLGGGNTFQLMSSLRKSEFGQKLYDFVEMGGILAGESAGAIVMTGNISTASFPDFDRDDNDINLMDWRGLDLINFEFFPHFQNRPKYSKALRQYTRNQNCMLMACCDGSGIVINEDNVKLCGEVYLFCAGKKFYIGESL